MILLEQVEVSVVIPTKNEETTIEQFVKWCQIGFDVAEVRGEIILADFSSDDTPKIAEGLGARVLRTSGPGLGLAYSEGIPLARGEILILGDADCTYDFREISPFIREIRNGSDFVIGTRFKGKIERGAMPIHHRYFGSPITTLIFNFLHGTRYSDIHCGMRALNKKAAKILTPRELGWQYASEMLAVAKKSAMKVSEVPISFYRAPNNRLSHLKRTGWKTPFVEGISALITSTKYAIDNILKYLSWLTFPFVLLLVYLSLGPQNVMGLELDLGTQIFCFSLSGLHVVFREFSKFSSLVYALNIGEVYFFDPGSLRKKFLLSNLMLFIFLLFLTAYSYQVITLSGTTNSTFYFDLKYWIAPISFLLLWSIISTVTESLSYFVFELSKGKRA